MDSGGVNFVCSDLIDAVIRESRKINLPGPIWYEPVPDLREISVHSPPPRWKRRCISKTETSTKSGDLLSERMMAIPEVMNAFCLSSRGMSRSDWSSRLLGPARYRTSDST